MKKAVALAFCLAGFCQTLWIARANAYCTVPVDPGVQPRWLPGTTTVNLYVHSGLAASFGEYVTPPPGQADVVASVKTHLHELFEFTHANITVHYQGQCGPGTSISCFVGVGGYVPNAIAIVPDINAEGSYARWADLNGDGYLDACKITLQAFAIGSNRGIEHEVLHCLGIDHPHECGSDKWSIMSNSAGGTQNWQRYEIEALEAHYATRTRQLITGQSTNNGATWATSNNAWPTLADARGPFQACNGYASMSDRGAFTSRSGAVFAFRDSDSGVVAVPNASTVVAASGIACKNNAEHSVFSYDDATGLTIGQIVLNKRVNGVWQVPLYFPVNDTVNNPGDDRPLDSVSAAYDPATGRYVFVFNQSYAESDPLGNREGTALQSRVIPGAWEFHTPTIWTGGPPTIACGSTSLLPNNCLVAFAGGNWGQTLTWAPAHVDPVTGKLVIDTANKMTNGWAVRGTAAVAYTGNTLQPWAVTIHQGSFVLYTFTKSNSVSAPFNYVGFQILSPARIAGPALGSWASPAPARLEVYGVGSTP